MKKEMWNLVEFVEINGSAVAENQETALQLFQFDGTKPDIQAPLWFLGTLTASDKADSMMSSIFQRAVQSRVLRPASHLFYTPSVSSGVERVFLRWYGQIAPKAIITFTAAETESVRVVSSFEDIAQKMATLSERPLSYYSFDNAAEAVLNNDFERLLLNECVANETTWIDFQVLASRKSFEDLKELDWKGRVGPALKWLVEETRFVPVRKVEEEFQHTIIPPLELPQEFANL